ncbi:MAG: oligoendopeptidase F [Candidatus Obscuribacterales bacterium]|nr:oligoendopeptidase F [Candidatus Obscuribacterales bacterium]
MTVKAQITRSEVPVELTWDLTLIYKTDADWEKDFSAVESEIPKFAAFKGKLKPARSSATATAGRRLLSLFKLRDETDIILGKVSVYATMRWHQDTANGFYGSMSKRADNLSKNFSAALSFVDPELLSLKAETLAKMVAKTPELELYQHQLDELNRQRAHVRSAEIEEVLAEAADITGSAGTIAETLDDADIKHPVIEGEDGQMVELTDGTYQLLRQSHDPAVRRRAHEAMFTNYKGYRNTFAATYSANVKADMFKAKTRYFDSCIERSLSNNNIPVSVYDNLVGTVHKNLPLLHRYLEMRKKILGLETLHYADLYVPLIEVDAKVSREVQNATVLAAVAPLGQNYVERLRVAFESRWIDEIENANKHSGAYSWGTYGTPSFMLLNDTGTIDSMYTRAHEAGHSMHSQYTREFQPYPYAHYITFVAEVASISNEQLLSAHLLKITTDPKMRLYILNHQLESIRTTLIRQTLFAEFERKAHAIAEAGTPLTADVLCKLHKDLNHEYYGAVVEAEDLIENEWARIPHFYGSFYVFTYATGIAAAVALSRQILTEGAPAAERHINFLKSGCSDYGINILRKAGVDLSTPAPVQAAFDMFAETLATFEKEYAAYKAS